MKWTEYFNKETKWVKEPVDILSKEACEERYREYLKACEDRLPTYQELLDEMEALSKTSPDPF